MSLLLHGQSIAVFISFFYDKPSCKYKKMTGGWCTYYYLQSRLHFRLHLDNFVLASFFLMIVIIPVLCVMNRNYSFIVLKHSKMYQLSNNHKYFVYAMRWFCYENWEKAEREINVDGFFWGKKRRVVPPLNTSKTSVQHIIFRKFTKLFLQFVS